MGEGRLEGDTLVGVEEPLEDSLDMWGPERQADTSGDPCSGSDQGQEVGK